jgi:DNA (cytosine-5)-methyltransferase 1
MSLLAPPAASPGAGWVPSPAGLLIPPSAAKRYDRPVGIDLFAGAGGFSLGCHQAGVHMAAAVEFDADAAITYLVNLARPGVQIHYDTPEREAKFTRALERHLGISRKGTQIKPGGSLAGGGWISHRPPWEHGCEHFWVADVRNITGEQILGALGLRRGEVTMVTGGPPCQGFSAAGRRDVMDPRNSLVFEFCRLVLEIWPKTFVMENVPHMLSMVTPDGVPVIDAISRIMSDGGFSAYDALRGSLAASAGNGGAMRRDQASGKRSGSKWKKAARSAPAVRMEQGTLL